MCICCASISSVAWVGATFPIEYAHHLFDAIFAAGEEFGIGMAGMRAMESLRLEKSIACGHGLEPDYTPYEAGWTASCIEQGPFIGKEALEKQLKNGVPNRFITFEVHGVTDADPLATELCSMPKAVSSAARRRLLRACVGQSLDWAT